MHSLPKYVNYFISKEWIHPRHCELCKGNYTSPRLHDVEKPIALIAPVSWKEEVYYLQKTNVRHNFYIYKLRFYHRWPHFYPKTLFFVGTEQRGASLVTGAIEWLITMLFSIDFTVFPTYVWSKLDLDFLSLGLFYL